MAENENINDIDSVNAKYKKTDDLIGNVISVFMNVSDYCSFAITGFVVGFIATLISGISFYITLTLGGVSFLALAYFLHRIDKTFGDAWGETLILVVMMLALVYAASLALIE